MISFKLNLFSNTLSMYTDCILLLPDRIQNDKKIPVLWLCHGENGDQNDWLYHSCIAEIPDAQGIAAVLVSGEDSCFADMVHGKNFAAWIAEELPPILYRMFPSLSSAREDNWICGLSDGGYGSLLLGLSHPRQFSAIGAFAAYDKADELHMPSMGNKMSAYVRIFGEDDIHDTEHSICSLVRTLSENHSALKPVIYHACGSKDPMIALSRRFRDTVREMNDPELCYVYEEVEGYAGGWTFGEAALKKYLRFLRDYNLLR